MARGAHGCSRLWVSDAGAHKLRHAPGSAVLYPPGVRAWSLDPCAESTRVRPRGAGACVLASCCARGPCECPACVVLRERTRQLQPAHAVAAFCRGRRHAAHGSLVCHYDREPTQLVAGGHDRHWSHRHLTAPRCGRRDLEDGDAECLSEGAVEVYVALPRADIRPGRRRQLLEGAGRC